MNSKVAPAPESTTLRDHNNIIVILKREKKIYEAGEIIKGQVILDIKKEVNPQFLNLKLKVKEDNEWQQEIMKQGRLAYNTFQGRVTWFNHLYMLEGWTENQVLQPKRYIYPFQFTLDSNHPVTFEYNTDKCSILSITKIKAEFKANKKKKIKSTIKPKIILNTKVQLNLERLPVSKQRSIAISNCFCCNQGEVKLGLQLEKNFFFPGDPITVKLQVDAMKCSLNIKNIKISLIGVVMVKDTHNNQFFFYDKKAIYQQDFPGIQSGKKNNDMEVIVFTPNNLDISFNQKIISSCYEMRVETILDSMLPLNSTEVDIRSIIWFYEQEMIKQKNDQQGELSQRPLLSNDKIENQKEVVQQDEEEKHPNNQSSDLQEMKTVHEIVWSRDMYYALSEKKRGYNQNVWEFGRLPRMNSLMQKNIKQ